MPNDLQIALDAIRLKLPSCQLYTDYYNGKHRLAFASEKFQTTFGRTLMGMRDNLCPIVVDAPADRLEVLNFAGDDAKAENAVADQAWEIWQREKLELTSTDVHQEALKCGYGYIIVWPDDTGVAKFYAQDSRQCVVISDEDTARKMFAAKQWLTTEKFIRITIYYADRIEKYVSRKKFDGTHSHEGLKAEMFVPVGVGEDFETPNPYGVIPMFEFETPPVLNDAIPIQDALNKTICDKLVAMEFAAFRQRWATGLEPPMDDITGIPTLPFKAGADRLWFTSEEKVKFGEFGAADLEQFLKVADSYRLEMARVSGTPLHFFSLNISDAISGEALKTLESRFTKKVTRLGINFGTVWAAVMQFALQIEGVSGAEGNINTQWASAEIRSEKELCETLILKQSLGVPDETLQEELGYTPEDIAKFKLEKERKAKEMQAAFEAAPTAETETETIQ